MEKEGDTVMDRLGQGDPRKGETFCRRADCLHCKGRYVIAQEQKERAAAKVTGEQPRSNPPKGTSSSIPGCTSEVVNYSLECMTCRKIGVKRMYIGESSCSTYQWGREHSKEIKEGVMDHPMA